MKLINLIRAKAADIVRWFRITALRIRLYGCNEVLQCFGDDEWGRVGRAKMRISRELYELTYGRKL